MDKTRDRVGYLCVIAIGIGAFVLATDFPPESAIFPMMVSGVIVLFGGVLLGTSLWPLVTAGGAVTQARTPDAEAGDGSDKVDGLFISPRRFAVIFAISIVYTIAVGALGYYTASILLIPIASVSLGLRSPLLILLTTILYVGIAYLLFDVIFRTPLTPELLIQLLR